MLQCHRKHTANSRRDLPGLVAELIRPLQLQREAQAKTFDLYRQTQLTHQVADHAILSMYREGVINIQRVPEVMELFDKPMHDEWGTGTACSLFNAATYALTGRVSENPSATATLHRIIDGTIH